MEILGPLNLTLSLLHKRTTRRAASARTHVFARAVLLLRNQPPWGVKGAVDGSFSLIFNTRKLPICGVSGPTVRATIPNAAEYGDRAHRHGRANTLAENTGR